MAEFVLTKKNYHSPEAGMKYMSVSQYKGWQSCEAATLARLKGEYKNNSNSDALIAGSFLHAWNEGVLDEFKKEHQELFSSRKPYGLLKKYKDIEDMIPHIESDERFMNALTGQKEIIFTANVFNTDWKIMADVWNPDRGRIIDLKTMASIDKRFWDVKAEEYVNFVRYFGYDIQMCMYSLVEQAATGREQPLEPYLAVVTKELPPKKVILSGFLENIDYTLDGMPKALERIAKIKAGEIEPHYCGECPYCRDKLDAKVVKYWNL